MQYTDVSLPLVDVARSLVDAGRQAITANAATVVFLALSGPLLITLILWYYTVTLAYRKNIPKMMGLNIGGYVKRYHPETHERIDRIMDNNFPWLTLHDTSRGRSRYGNSDGRHDTADGWEAPTSWAVTFTPAKGY